MKKILDRINVTLDKRYYLKTFLIGIVMGMILILPYMVKNGGYFTYYGDYDLQQIPFAKLVSDTVKSGDMGWCWNVDLGVNFIGSFGSYLVNPFFLVLLIFPSSILHYVMGPLLVVKMALSAMLGTIYIRRFVKDPRSAVLGGLLYGYSGFALYNIYFYSFADILCTFVLMLIALEEAVVCKRRGVFALTAALNCAMSPYFFFGQCIFLVIYFISRMAMSKEFRINVKDFFCLAFESIIGVAISAVILLPNAFATLGMSRVGNLLNGWDFMAYSDPMSYLKLVFAMFFPTETPKVSLVFPSWDTTSSLSLYLPLFAMAGVIAFMRSGKKSWVKPVLLVSLLFAFVPGLNAVFSMMNNIYYARWFYMPILIMALATATALDDETIDLRSGAKINLGFVLFLSALFVLTPFKCTMESFNEDGDIISEVVYEPRFKYYDFTIKTFTLVFVAIAGALLVMKLAKSLHGAKRTRTMRIFACALVVLFSVHGLYVMHRGYARYSSGEHMGELYSSDLTIEDEEFYRVDFLQVPNINTMYGMASPADFISVTPKATGDFFALIRIPRLQQAAINYFDYCFKALTRTKYLLIPEWQNDQDLVDEIDEMKMYRLHKHESSYYVYENDNMLPMGYAYERYIIDSDLSELETDVEVTGTMMKAAVLDKKTAASLSDLLEPMDVSEAGELTFEQFRQELSARSELGVKSFTQGKSEFTATTAYDRERLVVFSVPNEAGWSAEVSGSPAEIYTVNGGFMAVRVPAGEQTIHFTYKTPLLAQGIAVTLFGAAALGVYCVVIYLVLKKRPKKFRFPSGEKEITLHKSYIAGVTNDTGDKNV